MLDGTMLERARAQAASAASGLAENDSPKTMLLDGAMLEAARARAPRAASGNPVQTSAPAAPSSASSRSVASTTVTAIAVRPRSGVQVVAPSLAHPARPGVIATYQVLPARVDVSTIGVAKNPDPHLPMLVEGSTERASAFRALRRRLAEQKDPHTILVTSAQGDEGKTTCAANLALALAESGRLSVLLVEANLRRPKLSKIFGFRPARCLRAQLAVHREQIDASWATTELRPIGLHILALSPYSASNDAIHGPTFSAAIARWRGAFDYVVIDGPSILESCDASIIHDSVDAVVMVVRSTISRNRTVRRALEQISADMVAGMVLMDSTAG